MKYDVGWASQDNSADPTYSFRKSSSTRSVRFNFLIKGPDLWGAKTSAFIEGDFRGVTTGNQYGGFQLRHAFMKFNWTSAELMIGQNWQQWGMPYYGPSVGIVDYSQYLKGIRVPQIAYRYFFTKEFNAMVGITGATDWSDGTRQYNDGYARSNWPGLMSEIAYWSDRCGKIGPHNLKFALSAFYGRDKENYVDPNNAVNYKDDTINSWVSPFRYSEPIQLQRMGTFQQASGPRLTFSG